MGSISRLNSTSAGGARPSTLVHKLNSIVPTPDGQWCRFLGLHVRAASVRGRRAMS
jgi:hypothetical protein